MPQASWRLMSGSLVPMCAQARDTHCLGSHSRPLLPGKNATVFAYGQTGSGKTHTMNGSSSSDPGIIPRAIELLLNHIQAEKLQATIQGSWLEIYNEKIFDLLSSERVPGGLDLREAPGRSIVVAGLTRMDIKSMPDFQSSHGLALKNRSTGATKLNEHSSRSHFVLQLHISTQQSPEVLLSSKLHLIDLAGSEDNRRTGNSGARLVESGAINRSLFVLGQVVEALNKSASRVPYRDSKITRFLQDSLGGTALGLMIACISPEPFDFVDSYNTLNFATKSSFIKNNIVINETVVQTVSVASREAQLAEYRSKKKRGIEGKGRLNEPAKRARYSNNSGNSSLSENSSFEMSPGKFKDIITGVEGAVTHAIPKYIAGGTSKAEFIVSQMLEHEEFKVQGC
ncbi:P-loop containing nucleoside triphosphate hydrolase protein [Polychytrium aggregatum]|uniref:P-loop containing nucleoside triphosphate hydrolase protein n=1 Tax=Polychytrium aggregatum TaxID=110093 RepID=UPI0022FED6F2|nr:P-loop containing nucleoside triphosphate hydrolase protein [Polychytrium aggregatum]KAI9207082.1 P-loop containing nucleoside triphosphate hydrolase protein [Polychytrium aggregatum]